MYDVILPEMFGWKASRACRCTLFPRHASGRNCPADMSKPSILARERGWLVFRLTRCLFQCLQFARWNRIESVD